MCRPQERIVPAAIDTTTERCVPIPAVLSTRCVAPRVTCRPPWQAAVDCLRARSGRHRWGDRLHQMPATPPVVYHLLRELPGAAVPVSFGCAADVDGCAHAASHRRASPWHSVCRSIARVVRCQQTTSRGAKRTVRTYPVLVVLVVREKDRADGRRDARGLHRADRTGLDLPAAARALV